MERGLAGLAEFVRLVVEAKLAPGEKRIPLASATDMAREIIGALGLAYVDPSTINTHSTFEPGKGYPVGSVRRGKPDVGDIDIVATAPVTVADARALPGTSNFSGGAKQVNFTYAGREGSRKVNVWVFLDPDSFGAALLHSAGPHFYNVRIRNVAKSRGWLLSQRGLFDQKGRLIAGPTEASVQAALGIRNREAWER